MEVLMFTFINCKTHLFTELSNDPFVIKFQITTTLLLFEMVTNLWMMNLKLRNF